MKKSYSIIIILNLLIVRTNAQWTLVTHPPSVGELSVLATDSINLFAGASCLSCVNGNIFLTSDNGNSWSSVSNGLPVLDVIYCLELHDSILLTGSHTNGANGNGVFLSNDLGNNWVSSNVNLPNSGQVFITAFGIDNNKIFAGVAAHEVYLSADNGASWASASSGLSGIQFYNFAFSDSLIFVGTDVGVFKSANNGGTWMAVNNGLPANELFFRMGSIGTNILTGTFNGQVFLSTNYGNNWGLVYQGANFTGEIITCGPNVFLGVDNKVMMSADSGLTWLSTGFDSVSISSTKALAYNGTYLFASDGSNIWKKPFTQLTTIHTNQNQSVISIIPNPIIDKLNIRTDDKCFSEIILYDIFSRKILQESFSGSASLNTLSLSKGIYIYEVRNDKGIIKKGKIIKE